MYPHARAGDIPAAFRLFTRLYAIRASIFQADLIIACLRELSFRFITTTSIAPLYKMEYIDIDTAVPICRPDYD